MKSVLLSALLFCFGLCSVDAQQQNIWDLKACIQHAIKHNLSIKQADIQARYAALQHQQAVLSQYPTVNFGSGLGVQFGRTIDRTTNVYTDAQAIYQNYQLNSSATLYGFGRTKYSIKAQQYNLQAALKDVEKAANDVALNVATYYLQTLVAYEQVKINELQINQTTQQNINTQKRVAAGTLPELNGLEMESQLANDSANYIQAKTNYDQSLLMLKALLNIDAAQQFDIEKPSVEQFKVESLLNLQPELLYQTALKTQPLQQANQFRKLNAKQNKLAAQASLYPTLSMGVNLNSNFFNSFKKIDDVQLKGYTPLIPSSPSNPDPNYGYYSYVDISGTRYYLQSPTYTFSQSYRSFGQLWQGYGEQLTNNFGQGIGLNLSIPIFNGGQAKIAVAQAKLNVLNAELQQQQADTKLKQDIYTAYTNAINAMQKKMAGRKAVDISKKAFDAAQKRFDAGLINTFEWLTIQNNYQRAQVQQVINEYDFIFKMKLLEFYKGQGLTF